MASWDDIDTVVAALPETTTGTAYGSRAWRMRKKLLVWERPLRKTDLAALGEGAPDGDIVGLPTADLGEKAELLAAMPEVFFDIPHFAGHSAVLARLEALPVDVLEHLVGACWRRVAPKKLVRALDG